MTTMKLHTFTVEGSGLFPSDMLRYDSAWPATQSDSSAIDAYHHRAERASVKGSRRRVTLQTHDQDAPTKGRWQSFLWPVVED